MLTDDTPKTLQEAIRFYSDRDRCEQALVEARWPDGVACPHCGSASVTYLANQRRWKCRERHPRRQFSVKIGTIFEDSPVGLDKWFTAIWLIAGAKNGISSYELHRSIGVTQKTAWFMLHRVRLAMQAKSFDTLGGEVEVDETYIGGKARNMHKDKREKMRGRTWFGKAAVMGLLQRHGPDKVSKVRVLTVPTTRRKVLEPTVFETVETGSAVFTDELKSYDLLDGPYEHKVINHAERARQHPHEWYGEFLEPAQANHRRHLREHRAVPPTPLSRRAGVSVQQSEAERRPAVRGGARCR